jgi:hypothetical protein
VNRHRPQAGQDVSLGQVAIAHDFPLTALDVPFKKRGKLLLDRLPQQALRFSRNSAVSAS